MCLLEIHAARRRPLKDRTIFNGTPQLEEQPPQTPLNEYPESGDSPSTPISFPPPPNAQAPPLSSSPSSRAAANALTRALNLASKKLFGAPTTGRSHYRDYSSSSSPRRPPIISTKGLGLDVNGIIRDPLEDELLAVLEQLAQKTEILTHWADEMYEYVKAIPQSA